MRYTRKERIIMKETIVAATNNQGKLKEIREILEEYEIVSLKDLNCEIEVEENQNTFEGNSLKKQRRFQHY